MNNPILSRNGGLTPLFGTEAEKFIVGDPYHQKSEAFLWGFLFSNSGGPDQIATGVPGNHALEGPFLWHKTEDLVSSEANVAFYQIHGSFIHNWSENNGLLRGTIATSNHGLAITYTIASNNPRPTHWQLHGLALGDPLGRSLLKTIHDGELGSVDQNTLWPIMGDPTLRMHVIAPPKGPNYDGTTLSWQAGDAPFMSRGMSPAMSVGPLGDGISTPPANLVGLQTFSFL